MKREKKGGVIFSLLPFANLVHRVTVNSCNKQPRVRNRKQGVTKELFKATLPLEKSARDHTFSKRGTSQKKKLSMWLPGEYKSCQHHRCQRDQILPPTPASCRSVACTPTQALAPAMARPGREWQQVAQLTAK